MFLQSEEGGSYPKHIAYNLALTNFYRVRIQQETKEAKADMDRKKLLRETKLKELGEEGYKTWFETMGPEVSSQIAWFRKKEEEEVAKTQQFISRISSQ
jgi:hypothetical protein